MRCEQDGKVYDTEIAHLEASYQTAEHRNDLFMRSEDLMRTPTGDYFLFCMGGAGVTPGASRELAEGLKDDPWFTGQIVIPLSAHEVEKWFDLRKQGCFFWAYDQDGFILRPDEEKQKVASVIESAKAASAMQARNDATNPKKREQAR